LVGRNAFLGRVFEMQDLHGVCPADRQLKLVFAASMIDELRATVTLLREKGILDQFRLHASELRRYSAPAREESR
jgi:hypothetical protein